MRFRFPEPGSSLDFAAIPVAVLLIAGLVYLAYPKATHWWRCNSGTPGFPAWAPDGQSIAFGQPTRCGTRIATVEVASRRIQPLTGGVSDGLPAWSPDARQLIGGVREFGAAWSPQGNEVAYTHGYLSGPFDIPAGTSTTTVYVTAADGSGRRRLVGHDVNGGTPAWSPDGRQIALVGYEGVYVVPSGGGRPRRILRRSFGTPGAPSWSPDGSQIIFVGRAEIDSVRPDGSGFHRLVRCDCGPQTDSAAWSPDGRSIAYSAAHGIYLMQREGGQVQRLVRY